MEKIITIGSKTYLIKDITPHPHCIIFDSYNALWQIGETLRSQLVLPTMSIEPKEPKLLMAIPDFSKLSFNPFMIPTFPIPMFFPKLEMIPKSFFPKKKQLTRRAKKKLRNRKLKK